LQMINQQTFRIYGSLIPENDEITDFKILVFIGLDKNVSKTNYSSFVFGDKLVIESNNEFEFFINNISIEDGMFLAAYCYNPAPNSYFYYPEFQTYDFPCSGKISNFLIK